MEVQHFPGTKKLLNSANWICLAQDRNKMSSSCGHGNEISVLKKTRKISLTDEELHVYQEVCCSIDLLR
jgi:hypothetical protein